MVATKRHTPDVVTGAGKRASVDIDKLKSYAQLDSADVADNASTANIMQKMLGDVETSTLSENEVRSLLTDIFGFDKESGVDLIISKLFNEVSAITVEDFMNIVDSNRDDKITGIEFEFIRNRQTSDGDGITDFNQGRQAGDCYFLAGINAMAQSPEGREIIDNAITHLPNGNISVVFPQDPTREYIITSEDLKEGRKRMATGDDNMLALELAYEKFLIDHPKAVGNDGNGKGIDSGSNSHLRRLFGLEGIDVGCDLDSPAKNKRQLLAQADNSMGMTINIHMNESGEMASTDDTKNSIHTFTVISIDKEAGIIVLSDPQDSSKLITMKIDDLLSNYQVDGFSVME